MAVSVFFKKFLRKKRRENVICTKHCGGGQLEYYAN